MKIFIFKLMFILYIIINIMPPIIDADAYTSFFNTNGTSPAKVSLIIPPAVAVITPKNTMPYNSTLYETATLAPILVKTPSPMASAIFNVFIGMLFSTTEFKKNTSSVATAITII